MRRTMWLGVVAFVLLIQTSQCLASDDSPFTLTNEVTGFCLVKRDNICHEVRWTTGDRLLIVKKNKCLGVQGSTEQSEVTLYDCDEKSDLQKWECKNETLLALKGKELYINLKADDTAVLSKVTGTNSHVTISGTSSGACTRTYREFYTIEGNAAGKPCMFPFLYKDQWFGDCTTSDSPQKRLWCAVETKYDHELWGFCPTTSTEHWKKNPISGEFYQINTQSALSWPEAQTSCTQQGASLLSVTDPNEQAYVSVFVGTGHYQLWIGLVLDQEHNWQWTNGKPFRYLRWDSGHPLPNPGHNCALVDSSAAFSWQSSSCAKKMGYICYKGGALQPPVQVETGSCSEHWIPYNGHCFYLNRDKKTWSEAQTECRKEGGDLARIDNVEDQSFVISQLGYASNDELWIGLNDRRTEGLFDWADHSPVTFTSWEFGEPTVSTVQEDCVLIRGENGNWADRACEKTLGFICMKKSDSKPTGHEVPQDEGCKSGWKKHGSYCYFIGSEGKTFEEAKEDCKSSDSYLADVSTGVDNAFLVSLVGLRPEKHFWLGLSNQKDIDEFVWTNTKSVRFTHWNAEMPGHQQGCVAMTTGIHAGLWDVLPCTNKEKYICKHLAEGAAPTPVPPTRTPPKCPDDWSPVGSRSYCFKLFEQSSSKRKTWFEARDYCRAIGGDLLSIHSVAELAVVKGQIIADTYYSRAWIGLSAPDPSTGYVWSDGSPLNFQHWSSGEPNNKNNVESCAEFMAYHWSGSGWNDLHCETYRDWLCQIRAGKTPKPPPNDTVSDYNVTADGWLEWGGNQYYINQRSMAMEDARHFCKQRHGDLAVINSEAENNFLWKQISRSYKYYYIGLAVDLDGTFGWMDGSPAVFERWDENQPDFKNNDENCGAMTYSMGFWHDYNCGWEHGSICKRSRSAPVNTTAAPTQPPKGGCSNGWSKFDSKCYQVNTDKKDTWSGARQQCQDQRGNLVSILSRREQVYLVTQMAKATTTDLWIGMNDLRGDGFHWTDGRPRRYNNWGYDKGNQNRFTIYDKWRKLERHYEGSSYDRWMQLKTLYPEIFNGRQDKCLVMTSNPQLGIGKWIAKSCNDTNGFVCLRTVDPASPDTTEPTDPNNYVKLVNDSIKVVTQNMTWDEARKHCEHDRAKLANLRNGWIQAYVQLQALNLKGPLWIGLNKKETGGYFQYIDGWHLSFVNWDSGEPSQDRPCVYLDVDGMWKTAFCNQTMSSVCLKSTDVPPTESTQFPGVCPEEVDAQYGDHTYAWLPFKGHCYVFITEEIEWTYATSSCQKHGGILASIEDPDEQQFIQRNVEIFKDTHSSFWIGLFKSHKGKWLWLDKTVMDFTNWGVDEPDDDPYGEIETLNGTWRTGRRWHDRAYICKRPKVMLPKPTTITTIHPLDPRHPVNISLAVVLIIAVISLLVGIGFYLYKKSGRPLPAFDNPLYFSSERSQPDVVDTKKLIENAEEENPEPIITL